MRRYLGFGILGFLALLVLVFILNSLKILHVPILNKKGENPTTSENLTSGPIICRKFQDLGEALKNIEIACILDVSNKGLQALPKDLEKLVNLNELYLNGNKLTKFPSEVLQLTKLMLLDLSQNNITEVPVLTNLTNLQILDLSGNPVPENEQSRIRESLPQTEVTF